MLLEKKIEEAIDELSKEDSKQSINLTDIDGPIMKGKKGYFDTYYNAQIGCNEKEFIGYCEIVTAGNDKLQLIPTIEGIQKNTIQKIEVMLADADYGTLSGLEYMSANNIEGYVPYQNMNDVVDETKPFHSGHFIYQKLTDTYICPQNKELAFRRIREEKRRNQKYREYRTDACLNCPFQKQCCPKRSSKRVISREVRQEYRDEMKKTIE